MISGLRLTLGKRSVVPAILLLSASPAIHANWSTGFQSGIPAVCTTEILDEGSLEAKYYRNIDSEAGWQGGRFGDKGAVAICPSRLKDGVQTSRRLIIPDQPTGYVQWTACSAHPDFPDSYRVLVSEAGKGEWTELFSIEKENASWTSHAIYPRQYQEGTNIDVAFECTSRKGFMLLLDDVSIGQPEEFLVDCRQTSPVFVAPKDGKVNLELEVTSFGKDLYFTDYALFVNDELAVSEGSSSAEAWTPGATYSFSYSLEADPGETLSYSLRGKEGEEWMELGNGELYCSYYPRTLLLDKGTATWCNNCPEGDLMVDELSRLYPGQFLSISTHTGDMMVQPTYFSKLGFTAVPMYLINRNRDTQSASSSMLRKALAEEVKTETWALIESTGNIGDGVAEVSHKVEFALDVDNSTDRYRIAYTVVRDVNTDDTTYAQTNALDNSRYGRYYYLSSPVLPEMMVYHNVSCECVTGFTGIPNSLPSKIEASTPYTYSHSVTLPDNCKDSDNVRLITYILDTETGKALNAAMMNDGDDSGIHSIPGTDAGEIRWSKENGAVTIDFPEMSPWSLRAYTPEGLLLKEVKGIGTSFTLPAERHSGVMILEARQGASAITIKITQ